MLGFNMRLYVTSLCRLNITKWTFEFTVRTSNDLPVLFFLCVNGFFYRPIKDLLYLFVILMVFMLVSFNIVASVLFALCLIFKCFFQTCMDCLLLDCKLTVPCNPFMLIHYMESNNLLAKLFVGTFIALIFAI